MIRRIQLISVILGVLAVLAPVWLWAQSTSSGLKDFNCKADEMKMNSAGVVIYTGNVRFTSSVKSLFVHCQRLEATIKSKKVDGKTRPYVTAMNARGGVEFSALFPKSDAEKSTGFNKLNGRAQQMTYAIPEGKEFGIVRLEKAGGIQPTLTLTDQSDPDADPVLITGSLITIDLETEEVSVTDVEMEKKGNGK